MQSILIVINQLVTGGAERQVINDANLLSNNGFKITIAFYRDGALSDLLNKDIDTFFIKYKNEVKGGYRLLKHLKTKKYAYVFGHMFWALKVAAFPCYLTEHKFIFFDHGLGLWRKFYHIATIKSLQMFVKKIVVVSNKKKKILIGREKTKENKIAVIPNSYQAKEYLDVNKTATANNIVKIVFVGRFNSVKQLDFLPKVATKLLERGIKNFQFILCGSGEEEPNIKADIKKYNVSENFVLTGYVKNPFKYLSISDISVLPSRIEDFSVSLLEAGYAGLPLVVFDVGGNSEIVKNNYSGYLIEPFDIDAFATKLEFLIKNPDKRKEMGNNAHDYIKSNFAETHRLSRLTTLMNEL